MSAVDINTSIQHFDDHGGSITLDDGTNVSTVKNIVPGSVKVMRPFRQPKNRLSAASQQTPRMGNDTLGKISFQVYAGSGVTGQIPALAALQGSASTVKTFTAVVTIPSYRGASAGERLTTANAYFAKQPERTGGTDEDVYDVELEYLTDGGYVAYP